MANFLSSQKITCSKLTSSPENPRAASSACATPLESTSKKFHGLPIDHIEDASMTYYLSTTGETNKPWPVHEALSYRTAQNPGYSRDTKFTQHVICPQQNIEERKTTLAVIGQDKNSNVANQSNYGNTLISTYHDTNVVFFPALKIEKPRGFLAAIGKAQAYCDSLKPYFQKKLSYVHQHNGILEGNKTETIKNIFNLLSYLEEDKQTMHFEQFSTALNYFNKLNHQQQAWVTFQDGSFAHNEKVQLDWLNHNQRLKFKSTTAEEYSMIEHELTKVLASTPIDIVQKYEPTNSHDLIKF